MRETKFETRQHLRNDNIKSEKDLCKMKEDAIKEVPKLGDRIDIESAHSLLCGDNQPPKGRFEL